MNVIFYNCSDDKKKLNKVGLSTIATVNVQIENDSSILEPVLLVQKESLPNFTKCNYAYIPYFERFYFIGNIITKKGGLLSIPCKVDALTSFKSKINGINTLIVRQENIKDMTIQDSEFLTKVERTINYKNFSSTPFSLGAMNESSNCIALTVNGGV